MKVKGLDTTQESIFDEIGRLLDLDLQEKLSVNKLLESVIHYYETIIGCMPGNIYWLDKHRKQLEVDLKEAKERAESANLAKNEFLENMSHGIRTPFF